MVQQGMCRLALLLVAGTENLIVLQQCCKEQRGGGGGGRGEGRDGYIFLLRTAIFFCFSLSTAIGGGRGASVTRFALGRQLVNRSPVVKRTNTH